MTAKNRAGNPGDELGKSRSNRIMTTTLELGIMSEEAATFVCAALDGQTFMQFRVSMGVCPSGRAVIVATDYEDSYENIAGMALHCLAEHGAKLNSILQGRGA